MDAVAGAGAFTAMGDLVARLEDLSALTEEGAFGRLLEVAERCRNITKKADGAADRVDPALLSEPAELALHEAWETVRGSLPDEPARLGREDASRLASALGEPLHRFFDEVFVNAEDAAVRGNRLALLLAVDAALLRFADLCRIAKPAPEDSPS